MHTRYTLSLSALMLASAASAQEIQPIYEIGTEIYRQTFKATIDGRNFVKEKATMYGVNATVGAILSKRHALTLTGHYAKGKSDYTGSSNSSPDNYGAIRHDGQDHNLFEIRTTYGYIKSFPDFDLMTSIGLGYNSLTDRLDQMPGGDKRKSDYFFLPLGLEATFRSSDKLRITPKLGYNYLIEGTQHSYYSAADIGHIKDKQKNGDGLEISAAFAYTLANKNVVSITPFYRYWSVGDSEGVYIPSRDGTIYKPKNKTDEYGINLSYTF